MSGYRLLLRRRGHRLLHRGCLLLWGCNRLLLGWYCLLLYRSYNRLLDCR